MSAIPVSHFHAPPECMTIYREESHTPYQESLETPDLLPCGHLSRYLDSQGERDQYFIGAVAVQQFTGGWYRAISNTAKFT